MNKSSLLALTMVSALALTSCALDSSSENHHTAFLPLNSQGRLLYADQSTDTLAVQSTDAWKLEVASPSTPFFTITPTEYNVPRIYTTSMSAYLGVTPLYIAATPNTTGKIRTAHLRLISSFKEFGTLQLPVVQYSWLDIRHPAPLFAHHSDGQATTPTFASKVSAEGGKLKLAFRFYSTDKAQQSVTSQADWLLVPAREEGYGAGRYELELTAAPNPSKSERTAIVSISSAGVTTQVNFQQAGQP